MLQTVGSNCTIGAAPVHMGFRELLGSPRTTWTRPGSASGFRMRHWNRFGAGSLKAKTRISFRVLCGPDRGDNIPRAIEKRKEIRSAKKEHHLWMKRDSAGAGQKALNLIRIVSGLPNEREAVYGALDKWVAWETEFPLIAAAKALVILRKRNQWTRLIQVAKWMLNKGQGATMATYDTLLLAFDMEKRVDEAESLWNMILHTHTRSLSKQLFSRMISLYDHHDMPDKLIEVFADMEELGVRPDDDTTRRISRAFKNMGQEDKQKLILERYQCKWKYMHFNGKELKSEEIHCSNEVVRRER